MRFREILEKEEKIVYMLVEAQFGINALAFLKNFNLWVKEEGRLLHIFALNNGIAHLLLSIEESCAFNNLCFSGIPIGTINNEKFEIEVEGALLLQEYIPKRIIVKTQQFLYGKPIYAANIVSFSKPFEIGDYVNIYGHNSLHYGVGKALISSATLDKDPNRIVIRGFLKKPLDRGYYLRYGG